MLLAYQLGVVRSDRLNSHSSIQSICSR